MPAKKKTCSFRVLLYRHLQREFKLLMCDTCKMWFINIERQSIFPCVLRILIFQHQYSPVWEDSIIIQYIMYKTHMYITLLSLSWISIKHTHCMLYSYIGAGYIPLAFGVRVKQIFKPWAQGEDHDFKIDLKWWGWRPSMDTEQSIINMDNI